MSIKIQAKDCQNFEQSTSREWLETNGIGGYASSTVSGCNTRKYHGLLVSRLQKPEGKFVLLSKFEESLIADDIETGISTNQYVGTIAPKGYKHLVGFVHDKMPVFKIQTSRANITKRIMMLQNRDAVMCLYECTKNTNGSKLIIRPMLAYRDFHGLTGENVFLQVRTYPARNGFKIQPYEGMPPLYIQTTGKFEFFPAPNWYKNVEYAQELKRGFPGSEDLFCPGMFEIQFNKGDKILVTASTEELDDIDGAYEAELNRRSLFYKRLRGTTLQKPLKWSAHQFISTKPSGHKAITAGFPWFLEWGRDAMIALPGLMLHDDKKNTEYVDVLKEFALHTRDGVVPNFLGTDSTNNAYNSVDASMWFAWAVQQYLYTTKDLASLKGRIFDTLEQIFKHYRQGTLHNIQMREDGLISAGSYDTQITWMDANSNGKPVTPRNGCPVEVNALWYNFVCFLGELADMGEVPGCKDAKALAPKIQASFIKNFWLSDKKYLADLYTDAGPDESIRPNQVFAVSLPFSPLTVEQKNGVMETVTKHLYTPLGLRTLSPSDSKYIGTYSGGPVQRDAAYHSGTVWPWLIGHYVEALLKLDRKKNLDVVEEIIEAFRAHLNRDGLGSVSEIFDGDVPSTGHGCPSQAWSVAELLRLINLYDIAKK
ncbi:MAG: glycogen debranching enzyme family protein [Deltaproteobacteria bacterium]|nr:glycogen debranching enzyme family protein [Deltaproteobacteria bacterium]MBN2674427.1 glycogen debranching enzyme family protein [Deltaproteobacteria bacterium]